MSPTAMVICGALGREVKSIVDRRGWDVDIFGVSALLHLYPSRIVDELRDKLHELRPRYERLVVVYGDCGTGGRLEAVLEEMGASRLRGPHCYEMYAGEKRFDEIMESRPATYFLTDWLVRNFDRAVVKGLGLDRYPELKDTYFGNYESVLYLRQAPNPRLGEKAERIAAYLGLGLEIADVGLGEFEERLERALEEAPVSLVVSATGECQGQPLSPTLLRADDECPRQRLSAGLSPTGRG